MALTVNVKAHLLMRMYLCTQCLQWQAKWNWCDRNMAWAQMMFQQYFTNSQKTKKKNSEIKKHIENVISINLCACVSVGEYTCVWYDQVYILPPERFHFACPPRSFGDNKKFQCFYEVLCFACDEYIFDCVRWCLANKYITCDTFSKAIARGYMKKKIRRFNVFDVLIEDHLKYCTYDNMHSKLSTAIASGIIQQLFILLTKYFLSKSRDESQVTYIWHQILNYFSDMYG